MSTSIQDTTPTSELAQVHNQNDPRPLPELIAEQWNFALAFHDLEGKRYYAVQDWIAGVAQSPEPRTFWTAMKRRLKKARIELRTPCTQLPYKAKNRRTYQTDHAEASVLYQITQRMDVNTGLRDRILEYLAQSGVVMDEIRRDPFKVADLVGPEAAISAGVDKYKRLGKPEDWIERRVEGVAGRHDFTAALTAVVTDVIDYGYITNMEYVGLFKRTAVELTRVLKARNFRDATTSDALYFLNLLERGVAVKLRELETASFQQACGIMYELAKEVGGLVEQAQKILKLDIATGQKLLKKPQVNWG